MSSSRKVSALVRLITLSHDLRGNESAKPPRPKNPPRRVSLANTYSLAANKDTVQWAGSMQTEKPKLIGDSGDNCLHRDLEPRDG